MRRRRSSRPMGSSASTPTCYVEALDRYGKLFTDDAATVGDVKTLGADLVEPRESVATSVDDVEAAQDRAGRSRTGAPRRPGGTGGGDRHRLERADQLDDTRRRRRRPRRSAGHDRARPAGRGRSRRDRRGDHRGNAAGRGDSAEYNSAAFALQIAWLEAALRRRLPHRRAAGRSGRAGDCLHDQRCRPSCSRSATTTGEIDGIYGPLTVDAVKQLQADSDLPETGFVDRATAEALDAEAGRARPAGGGRQRLTHTASVQTVLTLTGFWTGPIDGVWTDELTAALQAFQTALGVEPTGVVDAATLAAFEQALAGEPAAPTRPPSRRPSRLPRRPLPPQPPLTPGRRPSSSPTPISASCSPRPTA